jgi:hypothetical protein
MSERRLNSRSTARSWLCLWCCAASCALVAPALTAQEPLDPVKAAGEALHEAKDLPWYDAENDDLKQVPLESRDPPPPRPTTGTMIEPDPNAGDVRLRAPPLGLGNMFLVLGVIAIGAVFIVIFSFILNALLGGRSGTSRLGEQGRTIETQADRVEDLPVPLRRAQSDLLGEARRQYERGDFNEAIIYLYSYLLVELDKANRIRLVRGKTNRQYLGELRDSPQLAAVVGETMVAFEDVYFGERQLSRERFEACFLQLDTFHAQLELVAV